MAKAVTPKDLKARLDAGESIMIVDVRESWEVQTSHIQGAIHIPMNTIPNSLDRIPKDQTVVFMCHTGRRSDRVADWLAMQGYTNLLNLAGGIDRWSREVDPSVPRY